MSEGGNGKLITPGGDNHEEKKEEKLSQIEELRIFLRQGLSDRLDMADEIMRRMERFVPMDEILLACKETEKGAATFINPTIPIEAIDHAMAALRRATDNHIYIKQAKEAQKSGLIQAKMQPKHGIMNFARRIRQ